MDASRDSYQAWIEAAERRLAEWLARDSETSDPTSEPLSLRDIASVVALIKALIEVRRRLEAWKNDGEELKTSAAGDTTDEEILELMERCEPGATDQADAGEMSL